MAGFSDFRSSRLSDAGEDSGARDAGGWRESWMLVDSRPHIRGPSLGAIGRAPRLKYRRVEYATLYLPIHTDWYFFFR